ncbi:MAG: hypothetical protein L3J79_02810 [Candidatus Marinimicrobia bacterium]|nr:hypothetical protein [Candidatus Neomarinimicrobiota bacterium]
MKYLNLKSFAIAALVCTFLYLSMSALAIAKSSGKSAIVLPEGTLKHEEIVELFSGQTVESVTVNKGRVSQTYYASDGSLVQFRNGGQRYGKWRVNKNDRICLQIDGLKEKCRIIVKEAGEVKKYIVKNNGQHQHSVSYRKFSSGKSF